MPFRPSYCEQEGWPSACSTNTKPRANVPSRLHSLEEEDEVGVLQSEFQAYLMESNHLYYGHQHQGRHGSSQQHRQIRKANEQYPDNPWNKRYEAPSSRRRLGSEHPPSPEEDTEQPSSDRSEPLYAQRSPPLYLPCQA
jgi:heat shock protein HspQ